MSEIRGRGALLRISRRRWDFLVGELGRRGRGEREAGAFLLARRDRDPRTIRDVVYLDDLDPNCLQGGIHFDRRYYSKLWDICAARGERVIADVHTHPEAWVGQSCTDRDNPMIAQAGHIALIVPDYATHPIRGEAVGVHLYGGTAGWTSWTGRDAEKHLFIRRLLL